MPATSSPKCTGFVCHLCRFAGRSTSRVARLEARRSHSLHAPNQIQSGKFVKQRISELGGSDRLSSYFPRLVRARNEPLSVDAYLDKAQEFGSVAGKDVTDRNETYDVYGRITRKRKLGSKLLFIDLQGQSSRHIQVVIKVSEVLPDPSDEARSSEFSASKASIRVGDWIGVKGFLHRTESGELSLLASEVPQMLAPSLQQIPEEIENPEFISRNRHVERIVKPAAREVFILRHKIIAALRSFLNDRDFVEVSTPLLGAEAGGALARPFHTFATELKDTRLSLRIAPELYLKRLVVGNLERVFEIGPAFRNEGVDHTHNPEFTICEFYQAMATLPDLMRMTEDLFEALIDTASSSRRKLPSIPRPDDKLNFSWSSIEFIPGLESAIQQQIPDWHFPDLTDDKAHPLLLETFEQLKLTVPPSATIPHLLDELASCFLESQSTGRPMWITHHPTCMSPLAKSFNFTSSSGVVHEVSARAELFIQGREYVNCYEEENSPIEQRRKFEDQIKQRMRDTKQAQDGHRVDDGYVSALEYGMPPTGGWGCGIDRLVMLFSGQTRIADVLPFGTLTNVVALNGPRLTEAKGSHRKGSAAAS